VRSVEAARMFAMLYTAGADSLIAVWNGKARWLSWRPVTAIREADRDGNPATEADPTWLPLINTPGYPEQPSGLSAVSAAMCAALEEVFGKRVRFSATSISSNTTRSFRSFEDAADEVVDARVYSGIHFRKADEDGEAVGKAVADDGLDRYFERD
jgi:PAP2 superfamily